MRSVSIALWLLAAVVFAVEPPTRYYMVGIADPADLLERAKEITSPDAKVWLNPQRTMLFVSDTPERHAQIAVLVQSLQKPPRNFSLKVRYPDFVILPNQPQAVGMSGGDRTGLTGMSSSPFGPGKIRFGPPQPRSPVPEPPQPVENAMTVNVASSKGAWLMVSPDPPNAAWIFQWGVGRNYWPAAPRWTQVKAHLYVEPKLRGEKIRLRLMPAFSYMAGATQRNVALEGVMTETTVASGEEVEVGSLLNSSDEFYRNFFMTFDRARKPVALQMWITPTLQ